MALVQTGLIWLTYAIAVVALLEIASVFVYLYQTPRDRAVSVTTICILSMGVLLATTLLLPVDIALVSSTVLTSEGRRKDWATASHVGKIVFTLKIVYYTLYSLDAFLCLLVLPFTYFWYDEYDDVSELDRTQTAGARFRGAVKYTLAFLAIPVILIVAVALIPVAGDSRHMDFDYFKKLLSENNSESVLTGVLGLLITCGTLLYCFYSAVGMALLPISFFKSASPTVLKIAKNAHMRLKQNRERQRQLERRSEIREGALDSRDRRELDLLVREERTLIRRKRLVAEASGQSQSRLQRICAKFEVTLKPLNLVIGIVVFILSLLIFVSMLITGIDKAKNSICKAHCGYILGHINVFQPLNWILVNLSRLFPLDYVLFVLLAVYFLWASIAGIAAVGIRFLWIVFFRIRKGHTSPQALLLATAFLTLIVLALNYSLAMMVAPQYSTFGLQTYCDREPLVRGNQPDCTNHRSAIKSCSEIARNPAAKDICTPSVASTFLNRIFTKFPYIGFIVFWAQFAFLGIYIVFNSAALLRTQKPNIEQLDADLEEEEEERLLANTSETWRPAQTYTFL